VVSIARIERPPLHRGGSVSTETMPAVSPLPFRASSPSLLEGGLFGLPLRATFSPACPQARRDVPLARARAFRFSSLCPKGSSQIVRASREHILIVRPRRARRIAWRLPIPPFRACSPSLLEGGLFGLLLRASNEGLRRPRVARAQETNRLPSRTPSELTHLLSTGWPGRSSNARVERAPSERARSASRRTTRLPCLSPIRRTS
jgi:hypothetical protein